MVFEVVLPALDEVKVRLYKESTGKNARKMRSWAYSLHSLVPSGGFVATLGMTFVRCWDNNLNTPINPNLSQTFPCNAATERPLPGGGWRRSRLGEPAQLRQSTPFGHKRRLFRTRSLLPPLPRSPSLSEGGYEVADRRGTERRLGWSPLCVFKPTAKS